MSAAGESGRSFHRLSTFQPSRPPHKIPGREFMAFPSRRSPALDNSERRNAGETVGRLTGPASLEPPLLPDEEQCIGKVIDNNRRVSSVNSGVFFFICHFLL